MRARRVVARLAPIALLLLFDAVGPVARAQDSAPGPAPAPAATAGHEEPVVRDLGNGRYRVGRLEIDRAAGRFRAPGRVLRNEPPLEFLVVARGGYKAYEALLEVDATAHEFNLACILIGLDSSGARPSRYHFDPEPAEGDPVEVFVEWQEAAATKRAEAATLLLAGEKKLTPSSWVYTGSLFTPSGDYLPHLDGTLIGFVHDPADVIEHRTGFIGGFGSIGVDEQLMPAVDTPVTVIVEHRASSSGGHSSDGDRAAGKDGGKDETERAEESVGSGSEPAVEPAPGR